MKLRFAVVLLLKFCMLSIYAQESSLLIRQGHTDQVNMVKHAPDGKFVYTAGQDNYIKKWDIRTGIEVKTLIGHQAGVRSFDITIDGLKMISADEAGVIRIWDLNTYESSEIKAHEGAINIIKLMPDQKSFLSGGKDKLLKKWDMNSGQLIQTIEGFTGEIRSVGISPDGKRAVEGGQRTNDVELLLLDLEKGVILDDALKHIKGAGLAKAYSAALLTPIAAIGNLAKGDVDKDIGAYFIFDYSNIEFRKDGRSVLISQNIYLPLVAAKKDEKKTGGSSVTIAELNADRSQFINVNELKMWRIDYPRSKAIYNKDQTKVIVNVQNSIKIYDVENAEFPTDRKEVYEPPLVREFSGNISWINSMDISGDFRTVVSSGDDRSLDIWDISSGTHIRQLRGYIQPALAVNMMPDGIHALVGSKGKNMVMWDIRTGRIIRKYNRAYDVSYIDVSPDGRYAVTASPDTRFFKLFNLRSGNIIATFIEKNDVITRVKFDTDPEFILAETENGEVKLWSKTEKKIKKKLKTSFDQSDHKLSGIEVQGNQLTTGNINITQQIKITDAVISNETNTLMTTNMLGEVNVYDAASGKLKASLAQIDEDDFIAWTPELYYSSSKGASKAIALAMDERIVPFEQMELLYNRPDQVAKSLGFAPDKLLRSYEAAYQRRVKKLGYKEADLSRATSLPVVELNLDELQFASSERNYSIKVEAEDPNSELKSLDVFVNDVPIYGINGEALDPPQNTLKKEVRIPLSNGMNQIKVSVSNKAGLQSMPEFVNVNYEGEYYKPELFLVSIGVSKYQNPSFDLSFAAKDANDVAGLFENSKAFTKVNKKILTDEQATSASVSGLKDFLNQAGIDDVIIFFIAGHGVLSADFQYYFATHDMDFLNPSNGGISYEYLEGMLDGIPCRNKVLFMDTCHSGELDKEDVKTVSASTKQSGSVAFRSSGDVVQLKEKAFGLENTLELSKTLFSDMTKRTGATIISAAGGSEFALEGVNSENGLFTAALIEGIQTRRADLNRDRKYSVSEIREYIRRRVIDQSDGQQSPTSREENIVIDIRLF